ncbi:MAG: radical SAM protein [Desulfobulbaceae bacterium]|nr:radical SAM protein [Desulfobulbaceae bacterium]HIJ90954.1 radical SAM protein [Deltaproteobacteria bacterium]
MTSAPGYLALHAGGELSRRRDAALERLSCCRLCPRRCGVNRLAGEQGFCRTGRQAVVSASHPHFGEEAVLVGRGGSGTIFFADCNLGCIFCQNYEISHLGEGEEVAAPELAAMMVRLDRQGCHNINLVTPSHVVAQILEALPLAIEGGLSVPLVYNSSGYDEVDTLRLLDGIVDIYMPDFKFWSSDSGHRFAKAANYPDKARQAIREMHRQVGDLLVNAEGLAEHGLLVRHLVMPEGLAETREILGFLAGDISPATYVNVMDQYRPCGQAMNFPPLDRMLRPEEYGQALELARQAGLTRLDQRDFGAMLRALGIV